MADVSKIAAAAKAAGIENDAEALVAFALGFATAGGAGGGKAAAASPAVVNSRPTTSLVNGGLWRRHRMRVKELTEAGLDAVGQTVTVGGWIRTLRNQKTNSFMKINDGSCPAEFQCILSEEFTKEGLKDALACGGAGACVSVTGAVVKSPAKGQLIEIQAAKVMVHGTVADPAKYPLAKKFHTVEKLREIAHLRPRTNLISAVSRVRNACAFATHSFFQHRGFLYVHTPCITASDCEGAGEMFSVTTLLEKLPTTKAGWQDTSKLPLTAEGGLDFNQDFFKSAAFLTVSGQLNVECFACSLSDVYTFGPTFRAEDSHTSRHLAEFWMIEPEICFADLQDDMALAEDYIKYCAQFVLDNCAEDLKFFDSRIEKGLIDRLKNVIAAPFHHMTYTEAVDLLMEHVKSNKIVFDKDEEAKDPLRWGIDLRSEHERYLTEAVFKKPVIVTNYPASFKAFYMRYDADCAEGRQTVSAMDILVPKIGEIIGGSQREERLDVLEERIRAQGNKPEDFSWYCDLRRYGSVPHAGFGLGFERLVQFVTGVENIRDVIPFPRTPGKADF